MQHCNFKDNKFSTHCLDLAFEYELKENQTISQIQFLKQHQNIVWLNKRDLMNNKDVHQNVKYYFLENAPNKLTCKEKFE